MAALAPDLPQVEIAIVEMTNAFRAEKKLPVVRINPNLSAAARTYAAFLAASNMFSHTADGRQHSDRAKAAGYRYCMVSENLSYNFDERGFDTRQLARDAVEGWKKSPGHLKNLVASEPTEIGVGVAKTKGSEKYYAVQLFGRPESMRFTFKIQNGLTQAVTYAIGARKQTIEPREIITHQQCAPQALVFERSGPPLIGRTLNATYTPRDGDLFTLKPSTAGGVVIDLSQQVLEPAKAGISR